MPTRPRQILSTTVLTGACVATYFGLRAVPVEPCDFLHYGDYVNAEGVIEGCGYEETGFFDLEQLRFPILAQITPLGDLRPGEETLLQLSLQTTSGKPLSYEQIAISHTERLHTMIVDPSLEDYRHLHPAPGGAPGTYVFAFTPERAGDYRVFLDFIPLQNSRRTLVSAGFTVPGEAETVTAGHGELSYQSEDLVYRIQPIDDVPFTAGQETRFHLEVSSSDGSPLTFSPVMDSYAHIVAFEPSRRGFAHFHPLNPFIDGQDPRNPDLEFVFAVDQPGHYRVWAQLAINGEERFIPFDLQVAEG